VLAGLHDRAHRILVDKLAPEAVIRDDLVLLRRLCEPLEGKNPDNWEFGGKVSCIDGIQHSVYER